MAKEKKEDKKVEEKPYDDEKAYAELDRQNLEKKKQK